MSPALDSSRLRRSVLIVLIAALCVPAAAHAAPRMMAEYEDHPALLLGCSALIYHHPQTLVAIARAVDPETEIYGLVAQAEHAEEMARLLSAEGLDPSRIEPLLLPTKGMWVRDYGPLFISDGQRTAIMDARYKLRPDDAVPTELAELWGLGSARSPLWCEGGHLAVNGQGTLLISTMVARLNQVRDHIDGPEITRRLQESLPFEAAHWIEPMPGEPTGHLDMFLTFVEDDRIVVASVDAEENARLARHLDDAATRLSGLDIHGQPLEVLRVPTPAPREGIWYTYTNVILIGDQVLVPVYPELGPTANGRALEFWSAALPRREVIGIDSSSIIRRRGALHCVSMPLPLLPEDSRGR